MSFIEQSSLNERMSLIEQPCLSIESAIPNERTVPSALSPLDAKAGMRLLPGNIVLPSGFRTLGLPLI
ncbi:hypothetical protein [Cohnella nanjingensis]|uniref:hypothetical protein n=1 Tax=Cohnella nanjingensis TaxID=1387779 RepID=UPI001C86C33A|nr:hypothetical protein [Cohnella nanjingensis]